MRQKPRKFPFVHKRGCGYVQGPAVGFNGAPKNAFFVMVITWRMQCATRFSEYASQKTSQPA